MKTFVRFACTALALLIASGSALAGTIQPVTMAAYQSAAAANKPIIFYVHADWCPVCAKQLPILEKLMKDAAFADYVVLVVDFDKNKPAMQMLHVEQQSTFVVNHGAKEVGRATGIVDEAAIRALFMKAAN